MSLLIIFKLLGSLALLMFGMKSMSEALQKMAGPQLRHVLGAMTTNRFTGALTGMFVTAAVQSSTATTLMTVSFVNAGLLTLVQAISVIMGANIGTTLTAWIMSLTDAFNVSNLIYPAFFIGIILIYMKKRRIVGDFLFGVAFLFLGLTTLKDTGFSLAKDPETSVIISNFFQNFNEPTFANSLLFLFMGTVLTLCVQSSAAIMAITMMLCSTGVLGIDQGVMLVLGENVGTTITSNIVAMGANTQARRAAFAHLSFNAVGVFWVLLLMKPFFAMVCEVSGFDPSMTPDSPDFAIKSSMTLATFHSAFNISNALLLIWFIPQIERFVCWVIKPKNSGEEEDFRLNFITAGIMKTPELSILEAHKEIAAFSERIQRMFGMVCELLTEKDPKEFSKLFSRIEKYEDIADNTEISIADYLDQVSNAHLSDETKAKIRAMLREISEVESIGDSCYNTETEINNYRDQLKSQNIIDVNNHKYSYGIGTIYMDLINGCEKMGDYIVNVVEARTGTKMHS